MLTCVVSLCRSTVAEAKGAIYLTTKNGTFPITLTSLKAPDDATQQLTPKILSATAKNVSQNADYWGDSDEMLFSNYVNSTYDEVDATYMWKAKRSINDAVSKNITLVLENLLKNYENSQLPTHGKGESCYRIGIDIRVSLQVCLGNNWISLFRLSHRGSNEHFNKEHGPGVWTRHGTFKSEPIRRIFVVYLYVSAEIWKCILFPLGLFDGLLLQTVLAWHAAVIPRSHPLFVPFYQDARKDLEARHLLLQRQTFLCTHYNGA